MDPVLEALLRLVTAPCDDAVLDALGRLGCLAGLSTFSFAMRLAVALAALTTSGGMSSSSSIVALSLRYEPSGLPTLRFFTGAPAEAVGTTLGPRAFLGAVITVGGC